MNKRKIFTDLSKMPELGVIIPLVILSIIFGSINNAFYSIANIRDMLLSTSYVFIAAIGVTFIFIARGLDLSLGSQLALSVVIVGQLLKILNIPWPLAIVMVLIVGFLMGSFNGFLIVHIKIPAFIATLATLYIYRGIVNGLTKGETLYSFPANFNLIGKGTIFGVPNVIYMALLLGIIGQFVLMKVSYGRYVFAVGGDKDSARLSGINTKVISFSTYTLLGVLMSISGIFWAGRVGCSPPTLGSGFEFRVISAVIIGGVSLFGGEGSMYGAFFGSLFLIVLQNGLTMLHVSAYWQNVFLGVIIILSILLNSVRRGDIKFKE